MSSCRACGIEVGERDDVVTIGDATLHAACVEPHKGPKRRRVGAWAAMGSRGQMAMGEVQKDMPTN